MTAPRQSLPVMPGPRSVDRQITFGGLAVAVAFLAFAVASLALPERIRLGSWLPLHLALAGAATTAIASVLPFFTTALAVARPVRPAIRIAGIAFVAVGAVAVLTVHGHLHGSPIAAFSAGGLYLAGLALVGFAAFAPLRGALGVRRRLVEISYAVALANVAVGATLAILFVAGRVGIADTWMLVKPAHAWLNVFGFVGLTIAATLIHLAPTTSGARIRPRRTATIALAGLAIGPALVAIGHVVGLDLVARLGGLATIVAGIALAAHGLQVHRERAAWTTEHQWHLFSSFSLLAGAIWFALAATAAGGRVALVGADRDSWSLSVILAPLVVGFVAQILVGAWTHLVPAVGPGGPETHARRRAILAVAAVPRLIGLNLGCAILWVGMITSSSPATLAGGGLCLAAIAVAIALFVRAGLGVRAVSGGAPAR